MKIGYARVSTDDQNHVYFLVKNKLRLNTYAWTHEKYVYFDIETTFPMADGIFGG